MVYNNIVKDLFCKLTFNMRTVDELQILDRLVLKNTDEFVEQSFHKFDPIKKVVLCKDPAEVTLLSGLVNKIIIV